MSELANHMTRPQGAEMAAMQAATAHGMAFWAGSGPEDRTCRECKLWGWYRPHKRTEEGALRPRCCAAYRAMNQGVQGGGVPHDIPACKYFRPTDEPPAIVAAPRPKAQKAVAAYA